MNIGSRTSFAPSVHAVIVPPKSRRRCFITSAVTVNHPATEPHTSAATESA